MKFPINEKNQPTKTYIPTKEFSTSKYVLNQVLFMESVKPVTNKFNNQEYHVTVINKDDERRILTLSNSQYSFITKNHKDLVGKFIKINQCTKSPKGFYILDFDILEDDGKDQK
jgi:hypothetical protein